jgi:hypothetical protein
MLLELVENSKRQEDNIINKKYISKKVNEENY